MLKYNTKLAVGTYSKLHKFVSFSTLKLQEKYCIKNYINIFLLKRFQDTGFFISPTGMIVTSPSCLSSECDQLSFLHLVSRALECKTVRVNLFCQGAG